MKVLFVTNEIPSPTGGGMPIRDYNLLRILSCDYEFTLLCFSYDSQETEGAKRNQLHGICKDVHIVPYPKTNTDDNRLRKLDVIERSLNPRPWMSRALTPQTFVSHFHQLTSSGDFDIVHANHIEMGILLHHAATARHVLGIEMLAPKARRLATIEGKRVRRLFLRLEEAKLRRYERQLCNQVDLWTMASEQERQLVQALCAHRPAVAIPNGVDTSLYNPDLVVPRSATDNSLLFVGSLAYAPNSDAVRYFSQSCWPRLKADLPQLRWRIIGRNPSNDILDLAQTGAGIEVTGWVDDIRPYLQQGLALVVPLRSGGGTRLKILEAMAAGMPVISTSIGAEGLNVTNGDNILLADEPSDFADAVLRVFLDKDLARSLSENGRRLVESQYDWRIIARKLDDAYQSLFR